MRGLGRACIDVCDGRRRSRWNMAPTWLLIYCGPRDSKKDWSGDDGQGFTASTDRCPGRETRCYSLGPGSADPRTPAAQKSSLQYLPKLPQPDPALSCIRRYLACEAQRGGGEGFFSPTFPSTMQKEGKSVLILTGLSCGILRSLLMSPRPRALV